jgi:hypothetical protein
MNAFLALFLVATLAAAQPASPVVPPPREILGYELGDRFTSHGRIEQYLHAVATAAPDRVRVIPYGATAEGRTLYLAVVSAPENLARLEAIKAESRKLSDPRSVTAGEAERLISTMPAIAWLSYGVHGNEASSPEAALNVLYQLASGRDPEAAEMLKHLVVVIDPLLNPDGHERYVNFQVTRAGREPIADKNAAEHNEDWPSGRTNHYLFDLNRDWTWLTQEESRARIHAYREWMPQVHVDFHEMGYNSSYFFFPAVKPFNKNLPKSTITWGELYGQANAAAFDAKGWSYWSGESFDLFYPGYGDSWPSLHGAIGMTYEQAGSVGVRVERSDETVLTLRDRLEHHSTSSLATLRATAEHREERLRDFYRFFQDAIDEGSRGPIRSYIIDPSSDHERADKMVALLIEQGVEVRRAEREFSMSGLSTYYTRGTSSQTFPAGTYIIGLAQPSKRLISALMEQEPVLTDTTFYDVSAWSLPVAYGVPTYWSASHPAVAAEAVDSVVPVKGRVEGGKAQYAYLLRWNSNSAGAALAWLLQHDCRAHVAMKGFRVNGQVYDRGTIILPVSSNGSDIHDKVQEAAATFGVDIQAARSGFTESGINLGSDRAVRLKKPKIIVATGPPVGTEPFGAIWSMFDRQYGIDFVPMKLQQLRSADLHDYTAIILPNDYRDGDGYFGTLDSTGARKLKTWVAGGGTLIGIEGGAAFISASVGKIASIKLKEKKDEPKDEKKHDDKALLSKEELEKRMTVDERERKSRLEEIPGTILRVHLDNSHPLGFGYDTSIAVFKTSSTMFELSEHGYNVGIYPEHARLSGYMSAENEKFLSGTPFLVHEQIGAGNVVLFADDPNFRLFWQGLNKVFLNSVLLMPSIRNVALAAE